MAYQEVGVVHALQALCLDSNMLAYIPYNLSEYVLRREDFGEVAQAELLFKIQLDHWQLTSTWNNKNM